MSAVILIVRLCDFNVKYATKKAFYHFIVLDYVLIESDLNALRKQFYCVYTFDENI